MFLLVAFLNGVHHGLGADHLMAVAAVLRRGGGRREAMVTGLHFGLGHGSLLLGLAGAGLIWNLSLSSPWQARAESAGGAVLVALGIWTLLEWLRQVGVVHSHPESPGAYHLHRRGRRPHRHRRARCSRALGALFALSGVRALMLSVLPLLGSRSLLWALLYALCFSSGVVTSVAGFGWALGAVAGRMQRHHWFTLSLSISSVLLGLYWIWSSGGLLP